MNKTRRTVLMDRLVLARDAAGHSWFSLTKAAGITHSAISRVVHGATTEMNGRSIAALADVLNVHPEWLVGDTDAIQPAVIHPIDVLLARWREDAERMERIGMPDDLVSLTKARATELRIVWTEGQTT